MKKILSLGILSETQSHQVWWKSQNLDTLLKAWFPVLEGFCIPQSEYEYFLAFHTLSPELQGYLKELEICYKDTPLALRSSASVEDSQTESYAGHFETFLGIWVWDLEQYILQSYTHFQEKMLSYSLQKDTNNSPFLWLLIQRLLESDISWVAFSKHPLTGKHEVYIEAVAWYYTRLQYSVRFKRL